MSDNQVNTNGPAEEKLFTQEQVNAIVGKRLAEQKTSLASELDQRAKEVTEKELELKAAEMLSGNGLPKELAKVLKYSDEKEVETAIDMIKRGMETLKARNRKIVESRLPEGKGYGDDDSSIREAFGL